MEKMGRQNAKLTHIYRITVEIMSKPVTKRQHVEVDT